MRRSIPTACLAVWSSGPAPSFARRLRKAGFLVDEVTVRANAKRGSARHVIWIATRAKPEQRKTTG